MVRCYLIICILPETTPHTTLRTFPAILMVPEKFAGGVSSLSNFNFYKNPPFITSLSGVFLLNYKVVMVNYSMCGS